jgi:preprotein translocase subunit YajC
MVLASGGGGGILLIVAYIAFFVLIMYFVAIRPQKKQQQEMLSSMEKGDSVLTSSGFYGVVIDITDDSVIVEFGSNKNCRIPMQKSAIVQIEKAEA